MSDGHKPEPWYWEAESDHCPHGPEPDDISDPAGWDEWMERHIWAPQDVRICLDAPAGTACPACSEDDGEMVPWEGCRVREHARPKQGVVPNPGAEHQPVTVLIGTLECLDRECDEYYGDDGNEISGLDFCSHIREEQACSCQRQDGGEYSNDPCPARPLAVTGGTTA